MLRGLTLLLFSLSFINAQIALPTFQAVHKSHISVSEIDLGDTTFSYTGASQTFTVPDGVTSLSITAKGSKGGSGNNGQYSGGTGAIIAGDVSVTPGATLYIIVGGTGTDGESSMGAGAGGGSWVYTGSIGGDGLLIVAGGGGGAGEERTTNGCDARTDNYNTNVGTSCSANSNNGQGGSAGGSYGGGGGAGWLSDGSDYSNKSGSGGDRFAGGIGRANHNGGYGGGGAGDNGGGGGGGYTGGPGGNNSQAGGGAGGSYFSSTYGSNPSHSTGNNAVGVIIISWGD